MYILTNKKQNNLTIAKIKGGYQNGKIIYIKETNENNKNTDINGNEVILNEIIKSNKLNVKQAEYEKIRKKISPSFKYNQLMLNDSDSDSDEEIEVCQIQKYFKEKPSAMENKIIEEYKKEKAKRFYLTSGTLSPMPTNEKEQTDSILITGPRGSGKSYLCAQYMKNYRTLYPDNPIIIFSSKDEKDHNFNGISNILRFEVDDEVAQEKIDLDDFKQSLVLFDDYENFPNTHKKGQNSQQAFVNNVRDKILIEGRTRKITCVMVNHVLFNQKTTKVPLAEANKIVMMNSCNSYLRDRMLRVYLGYNKEEMKKIKTLKGRWILFSKIPKYAMSEFGIVIF